MGIRLPLDPAAQVAVRAPAAELLAAVDLHSDVLRLDDPGLEGVRHRDRVVDRRAVPAVALPVETAVELEQLGHHRADTAGLPQLPSRLRPEDRLMRDVQA